MSQEKIVIYIKLLGRILLLILNIVMFMLILKTHISGLMAMIKKIIFTDSKDSCDVDNVFSMVNIDSGKYEVEVSKKEDNWYEIYGTDNMIKTSMCLSLALNEKAILSMDGYSAGELIFDDGDSCNVEGVYSPVRL
ncbi:hypothetical protein LAW83_11535 [Escherichia coli]|nr:hypothetical protein [Escherichia coli]